MDAVSKAKPSCGPAGSPRHSTRVLADIARRWGYGCEVSAMAGGALGDEQPLAEGFCQPSRQLVRATHVQRIAALRDMLAIA